MMKFLNICIATVIFTHLLLCLNAEKTFEEQWSEFKEKYNKTYESPEKEAKNMQNFKENMEKFRIHNENKNSTFKMALTYNADMNFEGFREMLLQSDM
jgi:hypothetical protein